MYKKNVVVHISYQSVFVVWLLSTEWRHTVVTRHTWPEIRWIIDHHSVLQGHPHVCHYIIGCITMHQFELYKIPHWRHSRTQFAMFTVFSWNDCIQNSIWWNRCTWCQCGVLKSLNHAETVNGQGSFKWIEEHECLGIVTLAHPAKYPSLSKEVMSPLQCEQSTNIELWL